MRHHTRWSAALGALIALLLVPAASRLAAAEEEPEHGPLHAPLDPDGGVHVDEAGQARFLYTPEFRAAAWLKQQLGLHPIKGLTTDLVTPVIAVAPPRGSTKVLPTSFGRILLQGPAAGVTEARQFLARLDLAERAVFVSILISEVDRSDRTSTGGSLLFDKGAGTNPEATVFRGASMSFEPDDYLRSTLTGAMPFEGTTLNFGDLDTSGGAFEYTLRMLQRRGEAEFLAWPSLLCTEGQPGEMVSVDVVPQLRTDAITRTRRNEIVRSEETGIKLRVTPVRIGAERATLDIDVWMRFPQAVSDGISPSGSLRLRKREVTTRLTIRDREPLCFGGIVLRHGGRRRRGLPRPRELEMLDPIHSAMLKDSGETEIVFLVRARIVPPLKRPRELDPDRYRAWTEVGPRAGAKSLPAPWDQVKHPGRR